MSKNPVVDFLLKERDRLIAEKGKMIEQFNNEIREMENAVDAIEGKRVWDNGPTHIYDDENPNYIKASQEEI